MKTKIILLLFSLVFSAPNAWANFSDVSSSHPHAQAIQYLKDNKIVSGNPDGTYKPDKTISRAAFTKIIVETYFDPSQIAACDASQIPLLDLDANAWFAPYICVAFNQNLVRGYDDKTFRPGNDIKLPEAAKIISAHRKGPRTGSPWFRPYLEDLGEIGAIPEQANNLETPLTRGVMAEMIYRIKANKRTKAHRKYADFFPEEKMEDKKMVNIPSGIFDQEGRLSDVTGGNSYGTVKARFARNKYTLFAEFSDLPEPQTGFFYEGWIVKPGSGSVISTGEAVKHDGKYVNVYDTARNLKDHLTYVLTIEPDDGDPAPADHVLEGTLEVISLADKKEVMEDKPAMYKDFSPSTYQSLLSSGDKFVLNFHATWCPNCKALDKEINARLSELPNKAVVLKVDYDSSAELKREFGVTRQTTGVFFEGGTDTETKSGLSFTAIKNFFQE